MLSAAVMTWHTYNNYGSLLQAYALQESFSKQGVTSYLIDYDPSNYYTNEFSNITSYVKYHGKRLLKEKLKGRKGILANMVYPSFEDPVRDSAYDQFRDERLRYTKKCVHASDFFSLNDEYDILACGSDQIWAPTRFNPRYYLDFAKDPERTLAYAPSVGLPAIDDEVIAKSVARLTGRIGYLSVREERGAQILNNLLGRKPQVVLDPTALLTGDEWRKLLGIVPTVNSSAPYAVCYFLSDDAKKWSSARRIAGELGLELKGIPVFKNDSKRFVELCLGVGPKEFISLIDGSSAVFTDSFHGTVFSLLLHKEPFVYKRFPDRSRTNQNSRISNILEIAGLGDSVMQDSGSHCVRELGTIDWDLVDARIDVERTKSTAFLAAAVREIENHVANSRPHFFPPTMTCCGCGACVEICPKGSLSICENEQGFLQASIDRERCIECGLCARVCPFSFSDARSLREGKVFSYITSNEDALLRSASGGVSFDIATEALSSGREVAGCVMANDCKFAKHETVFPGEGTAKAFQGSKYIQSDFSQVFKALGENVQRVVFGTPCQIAALRNFITIKGIRDRFILVDLICHGVPSIHLYRKMVSEFLASKPPSEKLLEVRFRDKEAGPWQKMCLTLISADASESSAAECSSFYAFFVQGNCYMDSCYDCLWRSSSAADIRVGDYWGPRFSHDRKGVSMVIALSDTGERVVERVAKGRASRFEPETIEDYFSTQQSKNRSKPACRDAIIEDLKDSSLTLHSLEKKWCPERTVQNVARKAKAIASRVING